jgi:hypothetical protein
MHSKLVFIVADHGLAIFYFLQSDVLQILLNQGVEVVLLTDDKTVDPIRQRFSLPGLKIEGLHLDKVENYQANTQPMIQWWLDFLRRAGAAGGTNLSVVESYIEQVKSEAHSRRKRLFPLMGSLVKVLHHSRLARKTLVKFQNRFTPSFYDELFQEYKPDLVIASSPGFRQDRYVLRAARKHNTPTAAAIISWDSSSSYGLPGAEVDWITCWSEIQKEELVGGADWLPQRVNVGGMPPYDGYIRQKWQMSREDYFQAHGLDEERKLISYASSFVSWSPNYQNVEALVDLVVSDQLAAKIQLLVRLHPIHMSGHYVEEADRIRSLAQQHEHVHVVEPIPLGELDYYSAEDVAEKTSMMAHSDIFSTVYSTMCVEASFQERPIVSICIDAPSGYPGKFWVPMSQIGVWPTHSRFRTSGAGQVALNKAELREALNLYLEFPSASLEAQRHFLAQECTFIDGSAGQRTGEFFLSLLEKGKAN